MTPALAYHEYLGPAMFVPHARVTLAAAAIEPHEHVLDVACGTGIVTSQIRAARVVGLDINPAMLEVASRTAGIEWLQGSALAMPLPDASFDVAVCQQGLQFFPDRAAGAGELRRVCRTRAVVACWQGLEHQACFGDIVRAQARLVGIAVEQAGVPFSFGDPAALHNVLAAAGFARVEVTAHELVVEFPEPARFVRMCAQAALATMPERFGAVDPESLVAAMASEVHESLSRHTQGGLLRFGMRTNVAVAFV